MTVTDTGFWYLASPYTKYPEGEHAAFVAVAKQAALLLEAGVFAVSAITHSHPIYRAKPSLGGAWETWAELDRRMIHSSIGMIVCMLDTWEESKGIAAEIEFAQSISKPVVYMTPGKIPWLHADGCPMADCVYFAAAGEAAECTCGADPDRMEEPSHHEMCNDIMRCHPDCKVRKSNEGGVRGYPGVDEFGGSDF